MTSLDRDLEWQGCFNVRDLGGLKTRDGRQTRRGAIARGDDLSRLTKAGWDALEAHGIRTIVDLRNEHEFKADVAPRPDSVETIHVPIEDVDDKELWEPIWSKELDGTPLYFRLFLERKPRLCAAALRAIALAQPGGVVFHCTRGRDRTGLVAILVLVLAGVEPDDIVADYEMSTDRVRRLYAALGRKDPGLQIAEILKRKETSVGAAITDLLNSVDIEEHLHAGGLEPSDVEALRERLVGPSGRS